MVVSTLLFDIAVRDKRTDSDDNMMQCSPTNGLREQEQQTLIIAVLVKGLTVLQSNRQLKGKSAEVLVN